MLALLWFGAIFGAIRQLLKYEEIHEPFKIDDDDDGDPRKVCKNIVVFLHKLKMLTFVSYHRSFIATFQALKRTRFTNIFYRGLFQCTAFVDFRTFPRVLVLIVVFISFR